MSAEIGTRAMCGEEMGGVWKGGGKVEGVSNETDSKEKSPSRKSAVPSSRVGAVLSVCCAGMRYSCILQWWTGSALSAVGQPLFSASLPDTSL